MVREDGDYRKEVPTAPTLSSVRRGSRAAAS
jgi:hypothetical protein